MHHYNILLCGVGGTGVIGFGNLLKQAAVDEGIMIVGNEMRGRAQRGGATTNTVRYTILGKNEPFDERKRITGTLPKGSAHLMIATEAAEALRNTRFLSKNSDVVINTYELHPIGVTYPNMVEGLAWLQQIAHRVFPINASQISLKHFGSYVMTNYILLGVIADHIELPIKRSTIESLLKSDKEKKAFEIGLKSIRISIKDNAF